jgi:enoyl-CoA hydratase/carnithine racemase
VSDITWHLGDDHVGVITLNRPEARNALTWGMYAELERLVRSAPDVGARCIVVTGADPAFCSGDDVRQVMGGGAELSENTAAVAGGGICVFASSADGHAADVSGFAARMPRVLPAPACSTTRGYR